MKYFHTHTSQEPEVESRRLLKVESSTSLPFHDLSPRHFEVLVYLLKKKQHSGRGNKVGLFGSSGDSGRDVVVFRNGRIAKIVQCKNVQARLTKNEVVQELLKIAVLCLQEPELTDKAPMDYELWSVAGISQPAQTLLNQWPSGWDEAIVSEQFAKARSSYKYIRKFEWEHVRREILEMWPLLVRPQLTIGVDIAVALRESPDIMAQFFSPEWTMRREHVDDYLGGALAAAKILKVDKEVTVRLAKRVEAFDDAQIYCMGPNYLLGVPEGVVRLMDDAEFDEMLRCCAGATAGIQKALATASLRKAFQDARALAATLASDDLRREALSAILGRVFQLTLVDHMRGHLDNRDAGDVIDLDDPDVFERHLVQWLYAQQLDEGRTAESQRETWLGFLKQDMASDPTYAHFRAFIQVLHKEFRHQVVRSRREFRASLPKEIMLISSGAGRFPLGDNVDTKALLETAERLRRLREPEQGEDSDC